MVACIAQSYAGLLIDSENVKAKLDLLFRWWSSARTQPAVCMMCTALSLSTARPHGLGQVT